MPPSLHHTLFPKVPAPTSPTVLEEDPGSDSSPTSSVSSAGTIRPLPGQVQQQERSSQINTGSVRKAITWHKYFEQELYLTQATANVGTGESSNGTPNTCQYHVYLTPPRSATKDPMFICHHGAGASGLSFALLATELRTRLPGAGVLAVDAREHGESIVHGSDEGHFSIEALSADMLAMIELAGERVLGPGRTFGNIVLIGHSLGGAVVAHIANTGKLPARLVGYVVIDVVEGSAMEALKSMRMLLESRPSSFASVEAAIEWHVRTRTLRNPLSARVSTPSLLRKQEDGRYVWRTDLRSTQPFWEDWFSGMSKKFLSGRGAKLLVLAGTDRLDKELMIGQMQGKFQLQVFPEAGHFVHEDVPEKVADIIAEFFKRNDRSSLVLPPKVSDLLKQGKKV